MLAPRLVRISFKNMLSKAGKKKHMGFHVILQHECLVTLNRDCHYLKQAAHVSWMSSYEQSTREEISFLHYQIMTRVLYSFEKEGNAISPTP